jgi:hypothetical protein
MKGDFQVSISFSDNIPVMASSRYAEELGIKDQLQTAPAMKARLLVKSVWVEEPLDEDEKWTAAYRLIPQDRFPIVAEIRIFPRESHNYRKPGEWSAIYLGNKANVPAGGLRANQAREIRWNVVHKNLTNASEFFETEREFLKELEFDVKVSEPKQERRDNRGRPKMPDLPFAKIAAYYVDQLEIGSDSPVADAAEHFKISILTARARLHQARQRGLLTGGGRDRQGMVGGSLTPKALKLLRRKK